MVRKTDNFIFVMKYKPETFSDLLGVGKSLEKYLQNEEQMPNFLFVGQSGTGKSCSADIISKKLGCDTLYINASDERGIDTIRDKVKTFAMTKSTNGKFKLIILDEMESMTMPSQQSLRGIIEQYHSNSRYILISNFEGKILEPLKSRCVKIYFGTVEKSDIFDRLKKIASVENIKIKDSELNKIVDSFYPDIRKCINALQKFSIEGNIDSALFSDVSKIFSELKLGHIGQVRSFLYTQKVDYNLLVKDMFDYIVSNTTVLEKSEDLIEAVAEAQFRMAFVSDPEIQFHYLLHRIWVLYTNVDGVESSVKKFKMEKKLMK